MTAAEGVGPPTDVLVVDDHLVFAEAISLAVDTEPGLRSVGTVGSAEAAIEAVRASCPKVVLLDLNLPGMGGLEAIRRLHAACADVRVIVLTADTSCRTLLGAVDAGADAFLPKELPFADVLAAIRDEYGPAFDRKAVGAILIAAAGEGRPGTMRAPELTEREREVLVLLAEGESVQSIARLLGVSESTCRGHVRGTLAKLGVHSQLQAVVLAARLGMLPNLRVRDP